MVERRVLACDICGETDAEHYVVIEGNERYGLDLCDEHASPIRDLVERHARRETARPRKTRAEMFDELIANSPELQSKRSKSKG